MDVVKTLSIQQEAAKMMTEKFGGRRNQIRAMCETYISGFATLAHQEMVGDDQIRRFFEEFGKALPANSDVAKQSEITLADVAKAARTALPALELEGTRWEQLHTTMLEEIVGWETLLNTPQDFFKWNCDLVTRLNEGDEAIPRSLRDDGSSLVDQSSGET